jgi:hypothetical protein
LAGSQVHPSPECGPRMNRRGANYPFDAAIAWPVLGLAELELQRLVHEAEKPACQDAANGDAVGHGPGAGQAVAARPRAGVTGSIRDHTEEFFALTGREGGFMICEGEVEELLRIAAEPETLALNAKAAAIVQDFEVQVYAGGSDQAIQELIGNYIASLSEIGYMAQPAG